MKLDNEFNKPLNQWVEDEIEVPSYEPKLNKKEKRIEFTKTTKKVTRKTMYVNSIPRKFSCADGHKYFCLDKKKYIFKCINRGCDWHIVARPIDYKYDQKTKDLFNRHTGEQV